ncbi:LOW QUALITY PROTEIN: atrial natriuretic peptide-converting enzyme [Phodopus roborovskii]|uniref:LOW QUALITY PROTEIN: atrial natriuretic peptide-converting enzyme n=1 Tax=Phodopus roborovskii TaxID=109678 RepID=UPI0021E50F4E|nr:LOW QUALITY PROTEIN: atrial natriuretic peptide-converting enzyme [Phodopus roborovskii]
MGRVLFSVRVSSVRRAHCSCPGRCYLSCRVPSTAGFQAPSGLGCARIPGEATGGAVGPGPSGTGGFLFGPPFQALGSWKDCVGAPPVPDVLRADSGVGEGCPQRLATTHLLRFLLLVLIPCICALIVLLAILLSFVGTLKKVYFKSNGSEPVVTDGEVQVPGVFFVNTVYNESTGAPIMPPNRSTPAWTPRTPPLSGDQSHRNTSACMNITHSQCQILPYHSTLAPILPIVKTMDVEKFLKFFMYLQRLSCYQHILLFGCSLAFPECIVDGDDRHGLLPCRSFCEAAKEGCEFVLEMVNFTWPDSLRCSQFRDHTENSDVSKICFSLEQEHGRQSLCGGHENFMCTNGLCLPKKLQCNGHNDCDDWSDEALCNCSEALFHCHTGKCLNHSFVCDGYDDCGDLSDEKNCECNPMKEHRCGDGRCIIAEWVCDGDHDCVDKSDEVNCSCYSQGLVECRNGQCIPSTFQCDGDQDCQDGSDEENCSNSQVPCPEGGQGCLNSSCLDSCADSSLCDSDGSPRNCSQCEPISLELCMNLPYNHTHFPNYLGHRTQKEASISWESSLFPALVQTNCYRYLMFFACTILVPKCDVNTGQRIPPCRLLCEHSKEHCESVLGMVGLQWPEDTDCNQFPEEISANQTCLLPSEDVQECSPSHFKCRSGRCVLGSRRCDGQADCDDDSDEEHCGCKERNLWECPSNKQCLKHTLVCDGFPDCPDGVDEKNCSFCQDNELECANHECVPRDLWCDGESDCLDSSDEWDCVTLSKNGSSSSFLAVHRSATEHHVCADGWQEMLSQLACRQMGLGEQSVTEWTQEQEGQHWLRLHSNWENLNGTTLQKLLVHRQSCPSRNKISLLCTKQDCGRRPAVRMNKRVLGGRTSRPGKWPWQCSLQSEPSGHICGCVLISTKWVLTVAHCFEGREDSDIWKVVFGINNLDHPSVFMQTRFVKTILQHPRYNRAVVDYDISIVELSDEIHETSFVRPVCLPSPEEFLEPDTYCYITGWGHMGNKMPFKLQEGEVRIISLAQCQSYFDMKTITNRVICAGFESGTVDSCMGDSGGPLVCERPGGQWTLFGLTSWGSVCFSKVLGPGVYSNVSYFVEWIQRQIYIQTFLQKEFQG